MRVEEATNEYYTTVLYPKTCELQSDRLSSQETTTDKRLQGCQLHGDTGTRNAESTNKNDCFLPLLTSKTSPSERASDLCTDKAVIEVSPELTFRCKEDHDRVIKDICVDEGLPFKKKLEISATDKKVHLVHSDVDKDIDLSVKDVASTLDDFHVDTGARRGDCSLQCVLPDSESIYDDDLDKSLIGGWPGRIKYIAFEKLLSKQSSEAVTTSQSFVATVAHNGIEHSKNNQVRVQEGTANAAEDSNFKFAKETSSFTCGSEMDDGTTTASLKLPEPQTVEGKGVEKTIDGHHHSHTLLEHGGLERDGTEGYTASSKGSTCSLDGVHSSESWNPSIDTDLPGCLCRALAERGTEYVNSAGLGAPSQGSSYGHNETNVTQRNKLNTNLVDMSGNTYPGKDPVSESIARCGPIAHSGSISLRSDSSTTSAHSFAFPILSSEWNTSPVKMVAADHKQRRKHNGWSMALLCCRF